MLRLFLQKFNGCISFLFYGINTLFWTLPMFVVAILKFLLPVMIVSNFVDLVMNRLAGLWIVCNKINQKIFSRVSYKIEGLKNLNINECYMVIANHQSWVDIFVLQNMFHKKIPFLKFFIKKELLWLPFIGQAWWALGFPCVNRYSKKRLDKKSYLIGKDLRKTEMFCKKNNRLPISIMSFVEGTRFSYEKHSMQSSIYKNLLYAKAGGLSSVLSLMGEKLSKIVDVTIAYPSGIKSFWSFVCGQIDEVKVIVRVYKITDDMKGDYLKDSFYRESFQKWLNNIWFEKDKLLSRMLKKENCVE